MRISRDTLPVTAETAAYIGHWAVLGGMHYAFETCAAGYDMDDLVAIFPNRACPVEHWGYLFKGRVRVEYTDGTEEIFNAGDAFHVRPGHRPYMLADTELLQLTRADEHQELTRRIAEAGLFPTG